MLLAEGIPLKGCDLALTGNVPLGSGLSSSAALEVATIHALLSVAGEQMDGERIARLTQQAENVYVGTNCGILDPIEAAPVVCMAKLCLWIVVAVNCSQFPYRKA